MRFAFSSLVALVAATAAVAQPALHVKRSIQINPDRGSIRPEFADEVASSAPAPEPQTNAKRFAAGLPPLAPRGHRRRVHRGGPYAGTRVETAPRAVSSPSAPVTAKCNLLVKKEDGSSYGYISPAWNEYGEYGLFQGDQAGALEVAFSYVPEEPSSLSQLDLTATNGPSGNYPFFGLVNGFDGVDDIGAESYSYGYVAGTTQTEKGSRSTMAGNSFSAATEFDESVQSAVWSYDPTSQAITAQWLNTDGSSPATYLAFSPADNALLYGGDIDALTAAVEGGEFHKVTVTCVPPAATQEPAK